MANEDPTLRPDDPEAPHDQQSAPEPDAGEETQPDATAPTEAPAGPDASAGSSAPTGPDAPLDEGAGGADRGAPVHASTSAEAEASAAPGAEGEGAPAPDALAEARRQRDEYLDHLRRERAEFENFRRRMARERAEALDRGAELLVGNLIGVLDNFGFVLEAAKDSPDEALSKGTQMVYAELLDVLRKAGLEEIPGVGEKFDPTWHEAMLQVGAEEPVEEPVVAEVLRPGYRFKDRVLRPASVSVAQ